MDEFENPLQNWLQRQQKPKRSPLDDWLSSRPAPYVPQGPPVPEGYALSQIIQHPPKAPDFSVAMPSVADEMPRARREQETFAQQAAHFRPYMGRGGIVNPAAAGAQFDTGMNALTPGWRLAAPAAGWLAEKLQPITDIFQHLPSIDETVTMPGEALYHDMNPTPPTPKPVHLPTPREKAQQLAAMEATNPANQQDRNQGLPLWDLPIVGQLFNPENPTVSEKLVEHGWNPLLAMGAEMFVPGGPLEALGASSKLLGRLGKAGNELAAARGGEIGKALAEPMEFGLPRPTPQAIAQEEALQRAAREATAPKVHPYAAGGERTLALEKQIAEGRAAEETPLSKWMAERQIDEKPPAVVNSEPGLVPNPAALAVEQSGPKSAASLSSEAQTAGGLAPSSPDARVPVTEVPEMKPLEMAKVEPEPPRPVEQVEPVSPRQEEIGSEMAPPEEGVRPPAVDDHPVEANDMVGGPTPEARAVLDELRTRAEDYANKLIGEKDPRKVQELQNGIASARKQIQEYKDANPGIQLEGDFQFSAPAKGPLRGTGISQQTPQPAPPTLPGPNPPPTVPQPPPKAPRVPIDNPNVFARVKNDLQIARELNTTLGRVAKNDFGNSLTDRARRALDSVPGSRIVYGKAKGQGNAVGGYAPKHDVLTVAKAGDYGAVFHESAHKIDHYTGFAKNAPADVAKELEGLGDPATVRPTTTGTTSWKPGMSQAKKKDEGFAEFMRVWMTEPEWLQQNAPKTLEHWNQKLEEWNDVGRRLVNHQKDYQLYKEANVVARTEARIMRSAPSSPVTPTDVIESVFDQNIRLKLLDEIAEASKGERLLPSESSYTIARGLSAIDNKIANWVERGALDFKTQEAVPGSRGLKQIFLDAGKDRNDLRLFEQYLLHKRADELHGRNIVTGLDEGGLEEIRTILGPQKTAHFDKLSDELYQFNDHLMKYMVDSGAYSQETADAMRKLNTSYVPFYRYYEPEAGWAKEFRSGGGAGMNASDPAMRIKGGRQEILPPVETTIRNAGAMLHFAHKNELGQALAKMWDNKAKVGNFFFEVEPGMVKAATVSADEVLKSPALRQALEAEGVDLSHLSEPELKAVLGALPDKQIWRKNSKLNEDMIRVKVNGEDRFFRLEPKFAKMWNAFDHGQITKLANFLSGAGNVLRVGATTLNPGFLFLRNPARDTLEAAMTSRSGFIPVWDTFKGLGHYVGNPEMWDEFVRHGGAQQFHEASLMTEKGIKKRAQEVYNSLTPAQQEMTYMGKAAQPFKNALGFLWHQYSRLGNISEQATRMGEFARAKSSIRAKNPGWAEHEVSRAAALEARDLLDFSLRGTDETIRNMRRVIPFFGAGLNGTYRYAKAWKENPLRTLAMSLSTVTAPTMAIVAMNYNDPDYWQIPQQERDLMWHLPTFGLSSEKFIRIPKPHLPGFFFGSMPERFVQWGMKHDKQAFDGVVNEFVSKVSPAGWEVFGGPLGKAMIELGSNHNFFFNKPIESTYDIREHPASWLRSNEYSSATAKALAKAMHKATGAGLSPLQIDHLVNSLTSYGGTNIVRRIIDPAVSRLTGESMPKADQRDPLGLFYKESRFESVDRFNRELGNLQAEEEAQGKTFSDAQRLRQMESTQTIVRQKMKQRAEAKDSVQRERLNREIRELTSKYTPAPGGAP